MRWFLLIAVLGLSVAQEMSFAQRPPGDDGPQPPGQGPGVEYPDSGYFASAGVVRFQLIGGRLQLDAPRHRKGSQNRESGRFFESITVTACRGIPSLHYVYQSPQQRLTLSVQNATHIRIESVFPDSGQRIVLDQPGTGPISWAVSQGAQKREHSGATLLHVRSDDPTTFDQHCGGLIQRILRGRSMEKLSASTEAILLQQLADKHACNAEAVHQCLQQLRSPKASVRRKAEKQLLSFGTSILPILDTVHQDDLDAEQRDRIRQLRRRLRRKDDDTPRSLAMMLINDRDHWSRLSPRLSREQLTLANTHLTRVGLQSLPLPSDPVVRIASRPE